MLPRLTERCAHKSSTTLNESNLPVIEITQDINRYFMQSTILKASETSIKRLPLLSYVWRAIRELSGDDAYERYIAQHITSHPDTKPLSRKDFFLYQQKQKWSGIQRCC
ncbi:MAG: YbdD/YjiX family protein [Candidatus Nitrotoga sp.]